ncbi:MAG: MFS transporter [Propionibacteriaceae bacterium]
MGLTIPPDGADEPGGVPGGVDPEGADTSVLVALEIKRSSVLAWGLWDWGSSAFNAVIVSFVFATYLTNAVGGPLDTPPGALPTATKVALSSAAAGVVIALTAPIVGQRTDAGGRRKAALGVWTVLVVLTMLAMYSVKDDYSYLLWGLVLLAVGSIFAELAAVSYNAMLRQVSTPATVGRVSGFGWSMGYFGGIVLLLICYVGFIAPTVGWFGVTVAEGVKFRAVAVLAAVWFAVFALPLFFAVPEVPTTRSRRLGLLASYRLLIGDLKRLWVADRNAVSFLIASALYRDGLAAVFSLGGVLAIAVYGMDPGGVIIFGIAANVVAALGAVSLGFVEDRVGPKRIITICLIAMIVSASVLLFAHGLTMFWIFGLLLAIWVGPAQSSSRSFLTRVAPLGREGQMFGLYAFTGRAVSWLAPALFGVISGIFGSPRLGIIGIVAVLAAGAVALIWVRPPALTAVVAPD